MKNFTIYTVQNVNFYLTDKCILFKITKTLGTVLTISNKKYKFSQKTLELY